MTERQFVRQHELGGVISAVFGPSRRLVEMARLAGGSRKGVYRLALDDGRTSILYVWSESESYWPVSPGDSSDVFSDDVFSDDVFADDVFADASDADLFVAGHARLEALGVRVPAVQMVDTSRRDYPADFAVVEDVRGGTLEDLIGRSPAAAGAALGELGAMLHAMHRHRSPGLGKVALVEAGTAPQDRGADQIVLDRALRHLAVAADRVARIAAVKDRVEERVRSLATAVAPRHGYGLIHGELGPDHVLIADDGRPVLIDIEGLMFFDVEWEHAFLRLRFGSRYGPLQVSGLDPARLRFYELAQSLSLVEGPLRIADGDFPDRDAMVAIATWHTDKVLRLAQRPL